MKFEPSINKDQINELPEIDFKDNIIIVDNLKTLNKVTPDLVCENLWGFDTETKPNFIKGNPNPHRVALLQMSGAEQTYLFRIQRIGLPPVLRHVLSQQHVVKAGVAVKDDLNSLQKVKKFIPAGFVDLQKEAENFGITDKSLRKLVALVMQKRLSKAQQLSNWENNILTDKQIQYAAIDAWACRQIYLIFKKNQV